MVVQGQRADLNIQRGQTRRASAYIGVLERGAVGGSGVQGKALWDKVVAAKAVLYFHMLALNSEA